MIAPVAEEAMNLPQKAGRCSPISKLLKMAMSSFRQVSNLFKDCERSDCLWVTYRLCASSSGCCSTEETMIDRKIPLLR